MKEEMIALLCGLLFSVAVFAFKTAAGEFYFLSGSMHFRKKVLFLTGTTLAYILLWLAAVYVTGMEQIPVLQWLREPRFFHGGAALHLISAAAFFLWGIGLLTGKDDHCRARAGWLLAVPCPVCAGAILLSVALGRVLMPEETLWLWGMAGFFLAVNLGALAVLRFLTAAGRWDAHRLTGRLMIFVGMYFAGLILLVPNFEQVEKMYRIAAGAAMPEIQTAWPVLGGGLAVFLLGWLTGWKKKKSFIKGKEQ